MVDYAQEEILSELSQVFRGNLDPVLDGGVVDAVQIHTQVMEIARVVFLLNQGTLLYLSRLIRNGLYFIVRQEIAVLEDMLIALDDLSEGPAKAAAAGNIGNVGPSDLADAQTALLSLEFAGSVADRPELARFSRIMSGFYDTVSDGIVSSDGRFVLPTGEARSVLQQNMEILRALHPQILGISENLSGIVDAYDELDIPALVSQSALINIRTQLLQLQSQIETSTNEENLSNSRLIFLRSITSKVVVDLLAQFTGSAVGGSILSSVGPRNIVGGGSSAGPFLAQAAGETVPGFAITGAGPWLLDTLSQRYLRWKIDGGAEQEVDLSEIQGPGLHGRNATPFTSDQLDPVWPGPVILGGDGTWTAAQGPPPKIEEFEPKNEIYLELDPEVYEFQTANMDQLTILPNSPVPVRFPLGSSRPSDTSYTLSPLFGLAIPRNTVRGVWDIVVGARAQPFFDTNSPQELEEDYYNRVIMFPPVKLGFKHLGAPVFFSLGAPVDGSVGYTLVGDNRLSPGVGYGGWDIDGQDQVEDSSHWEDADVKRWSYLFQPRVVTELSRLHDALTLTHVAEDEYTVTGGTVLEAYVGFYVKVGAPSDYTSWRRYEIVGVDVPNNRLKIDVRLGIEGEDYEHVGPPSPGVGVGFTPTVAGSLDTEVVQLYGEPSEWTEIEFAPDLLAHTHEVARSDYDHNPTNIPDSLGVKIGPAFKVSQLPDGAGGTLASAIASLQDPGSTPVGTVRIAEWPTPPLTAVMEREFRIFTQPYSHATYHVFFKEQAGFADKITIQGRSRMSPDKLAIAPTYNESNSDLPIGVDDDNDSPESFPPPRALRTNEFSGHEVFGFDIGQKVDPDQDPFISVEEVEGLVKDVISGGSVEVVETEVFGGFITVNPSGTSASILLRDTTVSFSDLGIGFGHHIELLGGFYSGIYIITDATGSDLEVQIASPGFRATEQDIEYRVFARQLKVTSDNLEPGSSVEITLAPAEFGLPTEVQHGVSPAVEAVDRAGNNLDMSALSAGDSSTALGVVASVSTSGSQATITAGVPANTTGLEFSFDSAAEADLLNMLSQLGTILQSNNLLGNAGLGPTLDSIDQAISPLVTPGHNLQANQNLARQRISGLLSILTSTPRKADEYSTVVPTAALNVEDTIKDYEAPRVAAFDSLVDSLNDHKFDRALSLLLQGLLADFFATDHQTATFAGALMQAMQTVNTDMPANSTLQGPVESALNEATSFYEGVDGEEDFDEDESGFA